MAIEELHSQLCQKVVKIFGTPVKVYREFNPARDSIEWTVYTRLFGYRTRFDIEIAASDVDNKYALAHLLSQLPEQIIDDHEANLKYGYHPVFPYNRNEIGNIANPNNVFYPEVT